MNALEKKWDRVIRVSQDDIIVETLIANPKDEIRLIHNKKLTPKQKVFLKCKDEIKKYSENLGGYVHLNCSKNELLFNNLSINRANISRLIYLSTFIDYSDRQENLLVKYTQHKHIEAMSKSDLRDTLKLGETAFKNFMSDMKKHKLIYENNNMFYITPDYFTKGNALFNSKQYTRIFINTTRFLYENCKNSRQHKQLSYIFQLIPFMNYELNILSSNPTETDFYKLNKLNLTQICAILGISAERRNMIKLKNELLKFHIEIDGNKYYFFSYVNIQNGFGIRDYFVINPTVAWGGSNTSIAKDILQTCFF